MSVFSHQPPVAIVRGKEQIFVPFIYALIDLFVQDSANDFIPPILDHPNHPQFECMGGRRAPLAQGTWAHRDDFKTTGGRINVGAALSAHHELNLGGPAQDDIP